MNIDELIKIATLERNGSAKEAFRAVKTEVLKNQTSKNPEPDGKFICVTGLDSWKINIELNELDVKIIKKLVKQREDSISIYEANNRHDLADIEKEQLKYLKELLPTPISDKQIKELILTAYPNGYTQKEMGKVIKMVKETFPTADGKRVSELVKEHII